MRRLRSDAVKLESRDQADDTARYSFGRFDQRKVMIAIEAHRGVKPASKLTHLFLSDETAKVFPRVSGSNNVTGTENPKAADVVTSLQELSASVTFYFHFLIYGMIT